ncbi:MAG: hypothetical protein ACYDCO_07430 [Armatimonadota bacterium]
MALMLVGQTAAQAFLRMFDLNMQFRYDLQEWKNLGEDAQAKGNFTVNYGLLLRRPLLPGSSLLTDLTLATNATNDANGSQANQGLTFNLINNQPSYSLVSRLNYNYYSSNNTGILPSTSSASGNYYAGLLLRQPAFPRVNLQFQRNVSSASASGQRSTSATNTWLMSGQYTWKALRFTYDQTNRSLDGAADSGTTTRRAAVTMDYPLLSGLNMTGELSRYMIDAGSSTSTQVDRRLLRITATPTRAISANLDYLRQSNVLQNRVGTNTVDSSSLTLNLRTEVRPGLDMDYSDGVQRQDGTTLTGGTQLTTRNRRLGISARLTPDTFANASLSRTNYTVESANPNEQQQDSLQMSLQTNLRPTTDLSINLGKDKTDSTQSNRVESTYAGVSLRDRTSSSLSLGAAYRWMDQQQTSADEPIEQIEQITHNVDLDALWQPSFDASINARVSFQSSSTGDYRFLQPSVNFRWQIDPRTNLSCNYNFSRAEQGASPITVPLDQKNKGISLNGTHVFRSEASLNLSYDFQQSNLGTQEWQRRVQMSYNFRL